MLRSFFISGYHVLMDGIGFSAYDLQELVYSLSYVNQRSTKATSVVAPFCYAHLAASQVRQFRRFEYGKFEADKLEKDVATTIVLPTVISRLDPLYILPYRPKVLNYLWIQNRPFKDRVYDYWAE
ncbi:hypothetical protein RYX36_006517 [Vicia faba]